MRSSRLTPIVLVVLAVMSVAGATWWAGSTQRSTADQAFTEMRNAQNMLTGIAEQELQLLLFAQRPDIGLLDTLRAARQRYLAAYTAQRTHASDEPEEQPLLAAQDRLARQWMGLADTALARLRDVPGSKDPTAAARFGLLGDFHVANLRLQAHILDEQDEAQEHSAVLSIVVMVLVAVVFGGGGLLLIARGRRGHVRRREADEERARSQARFREVLQLAPSEAEAHRVIGSHLAYELPVEADVSLMRRNNSQDRLQVVAASGPGMLPLAQDSEHPIECLSMKLNRRHDAGEGPEYLTCDLCGKVGDGATTCSPVLVAGEVIGSVVVHTPDPLDDLQHARVSETIDQAAPVLANLRNLAVAETRAATDALTGLPNRRALTENLHRMLAHAGRTVSPLAAVMLDLDHFKHVNDLHGHEQGDAVLAAVADVLRAGLRTSDLAGRSGGEEFVVLLPDTGLSGAVEVAEKLRLAIAGLEFARVDGRVTASFGVAVFPDHAADAETLLRAADRALYAAKRGGRNRVESTASVVAAG